MAEMLARPISTGERLASRRDRVITKMCPSKKPKPTAS